MEEVKTGMNILKRLISNINVQKFCGHCGQDFQAVIEEKLHCLVCGLDNRDGSKCCCCCGNSLQVPILLISECSGCGCKANEFAKYCEICGSKTTQKKAVCNGCGNDILVKKQQFYLFKRKLDSQMNIKPKVANLQMSNRTYILTVLSLIMFLILAFYILGYLNTGVGQLICSALCSFILTTKNIGNFFS